VEGGQAVLAGTDAEVGDILFLARARSDESSYLSRNAISIMLSRRYHAGGGTLATFGSHRIRHGTATMLLNNGMGLDEVSRYLGHSSTEPTGRYAAKKGRRSPTGPFSCDSSEPAG